jgi:hypothetical protein
MMIMMQLMTNTEQRAPCTLTAHCEGDPWWVCAEPPFPESPMGVALNVIRAFIITFKADPLFNLI